MCVIQASLRELKNDDPALDKIGALIGDAGSGYKSNQAIVGMRNAKADTGVGVERWHFNASGEGKRNDTDGHNSFIKLHRRAAMRAGHPFGCTTPEREVQAANYNGGVPGTSSRLLQFGYDEMKAGVGAMMPGIGSCHDFEYPGDGSIIARRTYGIGPGKLFTKEFLDKKYKDGVQGDTGARLSTHTDYPSEGLSVKLEHSARRKQVSRAAVVARREERLLKADQRAAAAKLEMEQRDPFRCRTCPQTFDRAQGFGRHVCHGPGGPRRVRDGISKRARATRRARPAVRIAIAPPRPNTVAEFALRPMGHGLASQRESTFLDPYAEQILQEQYNLGVLNSGNRKGIFEMEEAVHRLVPWTIAPNRYRIGSWLSGYMKKKKDEAAGERPHCGELIDFLRLY